MGRRGRADREIADQAQQVRSPDTERARGVGAVAVGLVERGLDEAPLEVGNRGAEGGVGHAAEIRGELGATLSIAQNPWTLENWMRRDGSSGTRRCRFSLVSCHF